MSDVTTVAPRPARAGRNLPVAIGVGLALAGLVVGTLLAERRVFGCVVVPAAAAVGTWELARALRRLGIGVPLPPLLLGGTLTVVAAYLRGTDALVFGLVATVLATLAWRLADGTPGYLRDLTAAMLVVVYVPFLAGFGAMLAAPADGARRVVAFVAAVAGSDVGGYVTGVLAGRHPMAPSVSPKKSWEGLAGSLLASVGCGIALVATLLPLTWWQGAVFGLAIAVTATVGDLGESLLKRDAGVKDMSGLLPGHGGLMDRLDSLLLTAPVAWLLLAAWAPPA